MNTQKQTQQPLNYYVETENFSKVLVIGEEMAKELSREYMFMGEKKVKYYLAKNQQ